MSGLTPERLEQMAVAYGKSAETWHRMTPEYAKSLQDVALALRELADLKRKLPVTADGVMVVPGTALWRLGPWSGRPQKGDMFARPRFVDEASSGGVGYEYPSASICYSTRAAAEAARETTG